MAGYDFLIPNALKRRIQAWVAERNPLTSDSIELHQRRLYILPTRFGYIYALMLLVLLLAAINYQNSMAYAMTFLLTALAVISLWQTHQNLLGLQVSLIRPDPVFSSDALTLVYHFNNPRPSTRYAVGIQYGKAAPAYARVEAGGESHLALKLPTSQRGRYKPARVTIFTRYPTGLFHAWGLLHFDNELVVYPEPLFDMQLEQTLIADYSGQSTIDTTDGDDFAGLREHRNGESLRHISWKAYAQGRGMLTKTFKGQALPSLSIRWQDMTAPSHEGKLSQMTALVIHANQSGRKFALDLPGIEIARNDGPAHYNHCLRQLATFQQADINEEFRVSDVG